MFDIFNLAICPMLYYCSELFFPLPGKTLKKLNKFTITYLRVALGLGKRGGVPLVLLFWHTGTYLPVNKILYYKAMFVFHISNLDDSSLAKEFYISQKANHPTLPSVVHEVEEFLREWNLSEYQTLTKTQFKKRLKDILYE